MTQEFNLSDALIDSPGYTCWIVEKKKLEEFIKLLKDDLFCGEEMQREIDALAGDKLT